MQDDRLLWMRRGLEPRRGFWAIPTGFLESGETPAQGAVREVCEELGLKLPESDLQLHGLGSVQHMNQVYVVFRARVGREVTLALSREAVEARFFTEAELPWDAVAFPTTNYLARLTYADMRRGRHGVYLAQHDREVYIDQS
jgi:ADP-ribose pyrophosphatase YjhB (NUDIX family)